MGRRDGDLPDGGGSFDVEFAALSESLSVSSMRLSRG